MADINDQEILGVVWENINHYAQSRIQWHAGSNRGSDYMNRGPLVWPSQFDFVSVAFSGDLEGKNILEKIRDEAQKCTAIRRVQTGRRYTGYGHPEWRSVYTGIAALHAGYRQSIPSVHMATTNYNVKIGEDANRQNLLLHIQAVKNELYNRMYHSSVVDLKVCHTSCHQNCHTSRNRR